MKKVALLLMALTLSAEAATFKSTHKLSNPDLEALAIKSVSIQKNEELFGDASATRRYTFTRKKDEANLNTVKQLNIAKAGLWAGEDPTQPVPEKTSGMALATALVVETYAAPGEEEGRDNAAKSLAPLLQKLLGKKTILLFTGFHADENGTWGVLDVLDLENSEVLLLKFGYHGT